MEEDGDRPFGVACAKLFDLLVGEGGRAPLLRSGGEDLNRFGADGASAVEDLGKPAGT